MTSDQTITEAERSQKNAEANFVRVARALPERIAAREEKLLDEFTDTDEPPLERLKRLYAFMDELYRYVNRHTPCRRGCDACCHYSVSVSELEASWIELNTPHERSRPLKGIEQPHGTPCPFLDDGECSIYSVRPFLCRRHVTLDDDARWCAIDVCHDVELPQLNFSEVQAVYERIIAECQQSEHADIRAWFGQLNQSPSGGEPLC